MFFYFKTFKIAIIFFQKLFLQMHLQKQFEAKYVCSFEDLEIKCIFT